MVRPPIETLVMIPLAGIGLGLLAYQGMPESVAALAPVGLAALTWNLWKESHGPPLLPLEWAMTIVLLAVASILHFTAHAISVQLSTTGVNWIAALRTVHAGRRDRQRHHRRRALLVCPHPDIQHRDNIESSRTAPSNKIGLAVMQRRPRGRRSEGIAREYTQHLEASQGFPVRAKVWILGGFILLLFGILTVQLVRLQILQHDEYVARAASNRVRTIDIPPSRGLIYDRDGNLLVENAPAYRITAIAAEIPDDEVESVAAELAELFGMRDWDIEQQIWERKRANDPFLPILIHEDPSPAQVIDVTSRRSTLPGVQVETVSIRRYEHGQLLGHLFGYVGNITESEFEELSTSRYLYSDQIGRTGIEAAYERQLRGTAGRRLVEVDAVGNVPPNPQRPRTRTRPERRHDHRSRAPATS